MYQRRQWQPTPVLLPGKACGRRSLAGCSLWCRTESDTTERLHFHFSLSCIGERNVNPLQGSCLENPRDSGDWGAAIYGVAHSQTRLKQRSSSSSSSTMSELYFVLSLCFISFSFHLHLMIPFHLLRVVNAAAVHVCGGVGMFSTVCWFLKHYIICFIL